MDPADSQKRTKIGKNKLDDDTELGSEEGLIVLTGQGGEGTGREGGLVEMKSVNKTNEKRMGEKNMNKRSGNHGKSSKSVLSLRERMARDTKVNKNINL